MSLEAGAGGAAGAVCCLAQSRRFYLSLRHYSGQSPDRAIVNGFQDVPEPVRELLGATGEFSTDAKQGPILAQSWYVLESIRRTVASAGGQMSDVIKLVQYFRNLDHFPYYSRVRKLFYPDQPPVSTVVQVSEMLPDATVLIEVEATVWLPPSFNSEARDD